ncbi:Nn.00g036190.m01.CDS01 [Neocucurbitaria sp. VM-36]
MRRSTYPPRPNQPADATVRAPEPPKRKVFNCIVDDTALVAGVKKSTRDGIRKWISQGAIRLFVPLHTLAQLQRLKKGDERVNADAREAVKWLDEVTSIPAVEVANRVQLEGVEEAYTTWEEVAQFLLPETLLSMEDSESDEDDYHEDLESSFNALDLSDETSMSSTHSFDEAPRTPESSKSCLNQDLKPTDEAMHEAKAAGIIMESPDRTARNSAEIARAAKSPKGAVPAPLQPLFNHILWRINKEENPDAALESFILLTNDPTKQAIAQKFGIRAKRLEQLRDAVAREDREYKNHLTMHKLEVESTVAKESPVTPIKATNRPASSHTPDVEPEENSDDEDVVLFQRAPRGPAATTNNQRVFDPNDFGRTNQHRSPRGGRGGHIAPRGRGGPPFRGRGTFAPRGAYAAPGPVFRAPPAPRHDPNQPIDPNSFTRPVVKASPVRGSGRRKLWEPN